MRRQLTYPAGTALAAAPVAIAGIAVLAYSVASGGIVGGWYLILLVMAALAESYPAPIEGVPSGTTSFATVFVATAGALYDWRAAAALAGLAMVSAEAVKRQRLAISAYNVAAYTLAGAAAGAVSSLAPAHRIGIAASLAFYSVDLVLLSGVIAAARARRYRAVLRESLRSTAPTFALMASLTVVATLLWRVHPAALVAMAAPLAMMIGYQRRVAGLMEKQRELDQLKDDFIAVTSHELRTPLTAIYGGAVTLDERELSPERRDELVGSMRAAAERLAGLVDDVLYVSRLGRQETPPELPVVNPRTLIQEIVKLEEITTPDTIRVVKVDSDVDEVRADPKHLHRVLMNLVDNAIKYSPDGGTVSVSCNRHNGSVRFVVADEGLGVPAEHRERIFDRFTRLDPGMSRGIAGTGLGLFLVRSMVEGMDGRVWCEANAPRGSKFVVDLPPGV